jgi:hypothetical protein
MPNWCDNNLTVTGDSVELKRFVAAVTNEDESIKIMDNLLPFPAELEGKDIIGRDGEVVGRAFTDEGYNWCIRNWGTKWGDCETEILVNENDNLFLTYQTAWSPALEGLQRISTMFPTLVFRTDWTEEGNQSIGAASFENGSTCVYEVGYNDLPSWEDFETEDGVDYQAYVDAIDIVRQGAIERV